MKIAVVQSGSSNTPGSNTVYTKGLIDYLRRQGHLAMAVSLVQSSAVSLFDPSCMGAVEQIRRFDPDIVLEECRNFAFLSRMNQAIKELVRVPIVALVNSLAPGGPAWGGWFKTPRQRHETEFFESVDGLIFSNRTLRNAVCNKHDYRGSATVAYPAGDHVAGIGSPGKIVVRARRCGPLQLLFKGDVVAGSGLIPLIRSLKMIPEGGWQLRVVGDDRLDRSYAKRIHRKIRRLELDGWIEFCGPLQGEALSNAYAGSHCLIIPFSSDRYELAVIEGMGYGLPAFCPDTGACRELVQNGVNGYHFSSYDYEGVAEKIDQLYQDRDKMMVMGLAAWSAFQQHPKWADCFGAIEATLLEAREAGGKQKPAAYPSTHPRNMIMLEN